MLPELQRASRYLPAGPSSVEAFTAALRGPFLRVIAEVKRASPSKGAINAHLDAAQQAARYVAGGAAAISVLTEPTRFGGSLDDLAAVAARVPVPVIRKDFLVHPVQLWEARVRGASAALLIVRALSPDELVRLVEAAHECGLATLVEVRDEEELARALAVGAPVTGVNKRHTAPLIIESGTGPCWIPQIPSCLPRGGAGAPAVGPAGTRGGGGGCSPAGAGGGARRTTASRVRRRAPPSSAAAAPEADSAS